MKHKPDSIDDLMKFCLVESLVQIVLELLQVVEFFLTPSTEFVLERQLLVESTQSIFAVHSFVCDGVVFVGELDQLVHVLVILRFVALKKGVCCWELHKGILVSDSLEKVKAWMESAALLVGISLRLL